MSDARIFAPAEMSDEAILQQIVIAAAGACRRWAVPVTTETLEVRLYPRDRGPVEGQQPYTVTQQVVERGIWRITLCPLADLPAGVPMETRNNVIRAQIARTATVLLAAAVDHVVQCGLFGEVFYR